MTKAECLKKSEIRMTKIGIPCLFALPVEMDTMTRGNDRFCLERVFYLIL